MRLTNGHSSSFLHGQRRARGRIDRPSPNRALWLLAGLLLTVTAHSDAPPAADPLARYVAEALASNASLKAQDFAVEAAAQGLAAARARRAPQLALNARYTVADGGRTLRIPTGDLVNPIYQTLNALTAGSTNPTQFPAIGNTDINFLRRTEQDTRLTLSAPLYAPQISAQIGIRAAEFDGARAGREAFARTLVRDVKAAYFQLAQAQAGVEILEASVRTLAENRRVAEALLAAGKATRDRALRAEAELLAVDQRLQAAHSDERNARRYLNLLRNCDEADPVTVAEALSPAVDGDVDAAGVVGARPELRDLDARISAADQATRLAGASFLPTLSLVADSGVQGTGYAIDRDSDVSTASLVLSWTLFDFGGRRAAESQARAQHQQLQALRDDLRRQLVLAQRAADDQALTAERALLTAEARVAAADEGFRIAENKRDAGQSSAIEFLDAERARTEARLGRAIARSALQIARAEQEYTRARFPLSTAVSSATP